MEQKNKKRTSPFWKALCGVFAMISAVCIVWGVISTNAAKQFEEEVDKLLSQIQGLQKQLDDVKSSERAKVPTPLVAPTTNRASSLENVQPSADPTIKVNSDILNELLTDPN